MSWDGVAGKRVVITGATRGIGRAAAKELARRGAKLTITARSAERGKAAAAEIGADVDVVSVDLAEQESVRRLAAELLERYDRIQVLINNAGAVNGRRSLTGDGLETTWAVNHLAPFLLTKLLLGRLRESAPARIITTASEAHRPGRIPFDDLAAERSYGQMGFERYSQTKLANILFTRELARRLEGSGVDAFCFHPGFVASGFNMNNGPLMSIGMRVAQLFARSEEKGAETLVWLADSAEADGQSGGYFFDKRPMEPSAAALDDAAAGRLWEVSEEQTAGRQPTN